MPRSAQRARSRSKPSGQPRRPPSTRQSTTRASASTSSTNAAWSVADPGLAQRTSGKPSGSRGDAPGGGPLVSPQSGGGTRREKGPDIPLLPVERRRRHGVAMADVQCRVAGQLGAQPRDVREPLVVEAVSEIAVDAVVDLVPQEDMTKIGPEQPDRVVRRLARAEVAHREFDRAEGKRLAVGDGLVRKDP